MNWDLLRAIWKTLWRDDADTPNARALQGFFRFIVGGSLIILLGAVALIGLVIWLIVHFLF